MGFVEMNFHKKNAPRKAFTWLGLYCKGAKYF